MNSSKNIILIGMRGSGKSHVGRELAACLNRRFFDTDVEIEKRVQKSIPELVASKGWLTFRQIETEVCRIVSQAEKAVIATGGGIVLQPDNISALRQNGVIIYLSVPLKDLIHRIQKSSHKRPSLTGKDPADELRAIWQERKNLYPEAADIIVENPNVSNNKAADIQLHTEQVIAKLKQFHYVEKDV